MANKLLYKKQWRVLPNYSMDIYNNEQMISYMDEVIPELLKTNNSILQKDIKIKIIKDFFEMYDNDKKDRDIPKPFGYYSSESAMKKLRDNNLLSTEMFLCLGNIFANYHELLIKPGTIGVLITPRLTEQFNKLYKRAINEYFGSYMNVDYPSILEPIATSVPAPFRIEDKDFYNGIFSNYIKNPILSTEEPKDKIPIYQSCSYGTVYYLNILIEKVLTIKVQSILVHQKINQLDKMHIKIDEKDNKYIDEYREYKNHTFLSSEYEMMKSLYDIFLKYGVIEPNEEYEYLLAGKNIYSKKRKARTLGSIINATYTREIIVPEYYRLIHALFDTTKLNIRNCIMHGNDNIFKYYNINVAAVLMQLLWDIIENHVFKNIEPA